MTRSENSSEGVLYHSLFTDDSETFHGMLKIKVREQIRKSKLTMGFIARKLNITANTLSNWTTGKSLPSVEKAFHLALLLNCKVDDLWIYEDEDEE